MLGSVATLAHTPFLSATTTEGWTLLMWAAARGDATAVRVMLADGADPDQVSSGGRAARFRLPTVRENVGQRRFRWTSQAIVSN